MIALGLMSVAKSQDRQVKNMKDAGDLAKDRLAFFFAIGTSKIRWKNGAIGMPVGTKNDHHLIVCFCVFGTQVTENQLSILIHLDKAYKYFHPSSPQPIEMMS